MRDNRGKYQAWKAIKNRWLEWSRREEGGEIMREEQRTLWAQKQRKTEGTGEDGGRWSKVDDGVEGDGERRWVKKEKGIGQTQHLR